MVFVNSMGYIDGLEGQGASKYLTGTRRIVGCKAGQFCQPGIKEVTTRTVRLSTDLYGVNWIGMS